MRQHFFGHFVLRAYSDRNAIDIFAQVLALLADLFLLFIVIGRNLVKAFLTIYLFDANKRSHVVI